MLETIREFGQEQLAASGQESVARRRHAAWALALAERAGPMTKGPDAAVWVEALEREHANLQTALTWFMDRSDGPRLIRMAVAPLVFWHDHGYYREGRQWLEDALSLGQEAPARDRMRAMSRAGTMGLVSNRHSPDQPLARAGAGTGAGGGRPRGRGPIVEQLGGLGHGAGRL
jgi:non-specific serine/threonine protein kinase